MEEYWTSVGQEYVEHNGGKEAMRKAFETIQWFDIPKDGTKLSLPMMPGEAIKEFIKEFRVPKVSRVGYGHELAPYGMEAIEGNYTNGRAIIYILDGGDVLTPLMSEFYPKKGGEKGDPSNQTASADDGTGDSGRNDVDSLRPAPGTE